MLRKSSLSIVNFVFLGLLSACASTYSQQQLTCYSSSKQRNVSCQYNAETGQYYEIVQVASLVSAVYDKRQPEAFGGGSGAIVGAAGISAALIIYNIIQGNIDTPGEYTPKTPPPQPRFYKCMANPVLDDGTKERLMMSCPVRWSEDWRIAYKMAEKDCYAYNTIPGLNCHILCVNP